MLLVWLSRDSKGELSHWCHAHIYAAASLLEICGLTANLYNCAHLLHISIAIFNMMLTKSCRMTIKRILSAYAIDLILSDKKNCHCNIILLYSQRSI